MLKKLLIESNYHLDIKHVILVNKVIFFDIVASKGPATWARDKNTKFEYEVIADYQYDEVREVIEECVEKCIII